MRNIWTAVVLVACAGFLPVACKAREQSPPAAPEPVAVPSATPTAGATTAAPGAPTAGIPEAQPAPQKQKIAPAHATAQSQVPPAKSAAATATPVSPAPVAASAPPPAATPQPAPPTSAARAASAVADPGGEVAVPPTKAGLTRVGVEKCKLCHKVQHASWATSAHAKRTPPLECESCHGPGNEYKSLAVMKDPSAAKAAGLVKPDVSFCARCHKGKLDPGWLGKAHAHKPAA